MDIELLNNIEKGLLQPLNSQDVGRIDHVHMRNTV